MDTQRSPSTLVHQWMAGIDWRPWWGLCNGVDRGSSTCSHKGLSYRSKPCRSKKGLYLFGWHSALPGPWRWALCFLYYNQTWISPAMAWEALETCNNEIKAYNDCKWHFVSAVWHHTELSLLGWERSSSAQLPSTRRYWPKPSSTLGTRCTHITWVVAWFASASWQAWHCGMSRRRQDHLCLFMVSSSNKGVAYDYTTDVATWSRLAILVGNNQRGLAWFYSPGPTSWFWIGLSRSTSWQFSWPYCTSHTLPRNTCCGTNRHCIHNLPQCTTWCHFSDCADFAGHHVSSGRYWKCSSMATMFLQAMPGHNWWPTHSWWNGSPCPILHFNRFGHFPRAWWRRWL